MSDLKKYIDQLERKMDACRQGRVVDPEHAIQKMSNAKKQRLYKRTKEKRDSAQQFLNTIASTDGAQHT